MVIHYCLTNDFELISRPITVLEPIRLKY